MLDLDPNHSGGVSHRSQKWYALRTGSRVSEISFDHSETGYYVEFKTTLIIDVDLKTFLEISRKILYQNKLEIWNKQVLTFVYKNF